MGKGLDDSVDGILDVAIRERDQESDAEAARILDAIERHPDIPVTTMDKVAVVKLLMRTNGKIIAQPGHGLPMEEYYLTAPHIGAGVYRVTAKLVRRIRR